MKIKIRVEFNYEFQLSVFSINLAKVNSRIKGVGFVTDTNDYCRCVPQYALNTLVGNTIDLFNFFVARSECRE